MTPLCYKVLVLLSLITMLPLSAWAQLANRYPHDQGIEADPAVLYVEKFDDGMEKILSRYHDKINTEGMMPDTDLPPGSKEGYSLKMTSITGKNEGGHLFKRFSPGFDSVVYVRYYVKYPATSSGYFHHEGVWFGGYNPATTWPNPRAGTCGLGRERVSISYEPVHQRVTPPIMDTYLYWGGMRNGARNLCYGNDMINQGPTAQPVPFDQWICVEVMIKLNHPVTAFNGELKVWHNGVAVGHWGPGFPKGRWIADSWYNDPSGEPFEGFRWREDAALNINWVWFKFYHDNPQAPSSAIWFDHLVMAKEYIGPISTLQPAER